jgi:hypothetical protein
VEDEAALWLHRPPDHDRAIGGGAWIHLELLQEARDGQAIHRSVHRQAHGVASIMGTQKNHGVLETAVLNVRHGHKQATG